MKVNHSHTYNKGLDPTFQLKHFEVHLNPVKIANEKIKEGKTPQNKVVVERNYLQGGNTHDSSRFI